MTDRPTHRPTHRPTDRLTEESTITTDQDFVTKTAVDQMVAEIFDEETHKDRKRGFYTDRARAYAASFDEPRNAQLQRSNIIPALFIANGRRLLPEQPDSARYLRTKRDQLGHTGLGPAESWNGVTTS